MPEHALVVGGSGMLRAMTTALTERASAVTSFSRTRAVAGTTSVAIDYRDTDALLAEVRSAVATRGPIDLVVAWIHETAPEAPLSIATAVASSKTAVRFFHVLGSAAADPSFGLDELAKPFAAIEGLSYHAVVLGFQLESGRARWLTDAEISDGVLAALDANEPVSHVGRVRPWSQRP